MPRYDFSCPTCGRTFEMNFPFAGAPAEVRCPAGHPGARRVYLAPAVVFKGNGFYVTDHRPASASGGENKVS